MLGLENLGMVRSLQDRKDINSRNSEQMVMVLLHNLENITVEVMSDLKAVCVGLFVPVSHHRGYEGPGGVDGSERGCW